MKTFTRIMAIGIFALVCGSAPAQGTSDGNNHPFFSGRSAYQTTNLDKAVKNYLECLGSANDGVIESAIAQVARMKLLVPDTDLPELEARIAALSLHGRTPAIRYKAYLTSMVFANLGMFVRESVREYEDGEQLFSALAGRLQQTLLGYSAADNGM